MSREPANRPAQDAETLEELRQLLFGEELAELRTIRRRMERFPTAEEVARALPSAVAICDEKGTSLKAALAPPVEDALKESVRSNPQPLLDVIFPLLGPAIRRAVQAALQSAVQGMNSAMEYSLNPKFRFDAWRSGMSFPQYVMLATLLYRVEHVFLVHKETGLLLNHARDQKAELEDADMVAGMLSAIQQFVADSFATDEGAALEELQYGQLKLMIVSGRHATLTLAIRGHAPGDLRSRAEEVLEGIHFKMADQLEDFEGDTEPFESVQPALERLVESESKPPSATPSESVKVILAIVFIGFLFLSSWWLVRKTQWDAVLAELEAEPGILVTRVEWGWRGKHVYGLRDPLAEDPTPILHEFDSGIVAHWEPIQATDTSIVHKRVRQLMAPPLTVKLLLEEGTLRVQGRAQTDWIRRARILAPAIPGVERYVETGLEDLDPLERIKARLNPPVSVTLVLDEDHLVASGSAENTWIQEAIARTEKDPEVKDFDVSALENLEETRFNKRRAQLQSRYIYFNSGTTQAKPPVNKVLDATARDWLAMLRISQKIKRKATLKVIGQSDAVGDPKTNEKLSLARAKIIRDELVKRGVKATDIQLDSLTSPNEDPRLRRVLFQVD